MTTYYEVLSSSGGFELDTEPPRWQKALEEIRQHCAKEDIDYDEDHDLLVYEVDPPNGRQRPIWPEGPGAWDCYE